MRGAMKKSRVCVVEMNGRQRERVWPNLEKSFEDSKG